MTKIYTDKSDSSKGYHSNGNPAMTKWVLENFDVDEENGGRFYYDILMRDSFGYIVKSTKKLGAYAGHVITDGNRRRVKMNLNHNNKICRGTRYRVEERTGRFYEFDTVENSKLARYSDCVLTTS